MSHIFISHAEEDLLTAKEIADGLEAAGYATWYYERDTVPGVSYLVQITNALEQCVGVILIVSPISIRRNQVTREVIHAFEKGRPILPLLRGITYQALQESQPEWRHVLAGTASISISEEGVRRCLDRILDGLRVLSIEPGGERMQKQEIGSPVVTPATRIPKYLAEKIRAARPKMEGELKQVTILFAEVSGFASPSKKLDPEEVQGLTVNCLDVLVEEVHQHEGTVAQFTGDGLMALFGAPIAQEYATQHALHAAVNVQLRLARYAQELVEQGIEFEVRVGVNTGVVVIGKIMDDLTMDYYPMGDTVSLALRMKNAASTGTILVTENTYRLAQGYFEFRPMPSVDLKGASEPVKTYQVVGLGSVRTRLGASMARGLTKFVGRERELNHLSVCFDHARAGQGQLIGIVGEAGVGKSRLLFEMRQELPSGTYTYLEGRCAHHGVSTAYMPICDIIKSYFDIKEGDSDSLMKGKVEDKISRLGRELKYVLPPLYDLLSLKVEDDGYLKLEAQHRRVKTFEALRDLLIWGSQGEPLVIAIDDVQWIDNTSQEFLNYIVGWLANSHLLLILLYRPEYTHPWGGKSYYSQISVDQLPTRASRKLLKSILEEGEIEPELGELILGKAGGNPLFMEEITRSLLENGSIKMRERLYVLSKKGPEVQVPDTIQGIIASRIDRLDDTLKKTMQVASVIGRDFAFRILQRITGMKEELKANLLDLQASEFIYEKSLFPELEYLFKHALTQEVAYNGILLKRRRQIHDEIGNAIEELYSDRLDEFYEMLAHHYSRSENLDKAYQYLKLSGDKANRKSSNWEAFQFYKGAIKILDSLPRTDENRRKGIAVRLLTDTPMRLLAYPEDSLQILQDGERLSREMGDDRGIANFCSSMGFYYSSLGNAQLGRDYTERCFEHASRARDVDLVVPVGFDLCASYNMTGEFRRLADVASKVIELLESKAGEKTFFGGPFNFDYYSATYSYCGYALGYLGDFKEGRRMCEKGLASAVGTGNPITMGWAEFMYGFLHCVQGNGKEAADYFVKSIRHQEEVQSVVIIGLTWGGLGWAHYFLGEMDNALKHTQKAIDIQRSQGLPLGSSQYPYYQAVAYLGMGDLDSAQRCIKESIELAKERKEKWFEGMAWILRGEALARVDRTRCGEAEENILNGIKLLDELGIRSYSAVGLLRLGQCYVNAGHREKALEVLNRTEGAFREMGMGYWLQITQTLVESLRTS